MVLRDEDMTTIRLPPKSPPPFTAPEFGPDATATPSKPDTFDKTAKSTTKAPLASLGQNKSPRSGIRKLSDVDHARISAWYRNIGDICKMFHPRLAAALHDKADDATDAWFALAENNDRVRRGILAVVEGGDWGAVITAHIPILIAVIPERVLEKIMLSGVGLIAKFAADAPSTEEPSLDDEYLAENLSA